MLVWPVPSHVIWGLREDLLILVVRGGDALVRYMRRVAVNTAQ